MGRGTVGRRWVLDANDGVMTTTGAVQGFLGAGADQTTVTVAATLIMITGALSLAAGTFAEVAQDRAHELEIVEQQREELAKTPRHERNELYEHYLERGLDPELASQVADQLTQRQPLAAHLETEFGILDKPMRAWEPWWAAFLTVCGYVSGALPLTITVLFVPEPWRMFVSVAVVVASLTITGILSWATGNGTVWRAVSRSLITGLVVAVMSYLAGVALESIDQFVPQIDIDHDG